VFERPPLDSCQGFGARSTTKALLQRPLLQRRDQVRVLMTPAAAAAVSTLAVCLRLPSTPKRRSFASRRPVQARALRPHLCWTDAIAGTCCRLKCSKRSPPPCRMPLRVGPARQRSSFIFAAHRALPPPSPPSLSCPFLRTPFLFAALNSLDCQTESRLVPMHRAAPRTSAPARLFLPTAHL
jgi:hypothetical protein